MKASIRKISVSLGLLFAALTLSLSARADYLQGDTSPFQGAPLQSMLQGSSAAGPQSLSTTQLVWGSSLSVNTLSLPGAGTLTVHLRDLRWPEALQSLQVLVTDLDSVWVNSAGRDSFSVFVSGPTNLFAAVYARSAEGTLGLYNLHASFAPVPLPAAMWLLLSGLGGLGLLRRRRNANH